MSSIFMNIRDACSETGLSMFYLRSGCKDGTIPHIRCGNKLMINIPMLLEKLDKESKPMKGDQ